MKNKTDKQKRPKALPASSKPKEDCCANGVLGFFMGAVTFLIILYIWSCFNDHKFETYDCAINRAFEPVQIRGINSDNTYVVQPMKTFRLTSSWVLVKDFERGEQLKSIDFVDSTYTKIECESKEYP